MSDAAPGHDPYDPATEHNYKSRTPKGDTPLGEAMLYWMNYQLWYGTPQGMPTRSLMSTFLRCVDEINRQTEVITTLRQDLKEAKARNTMYLSKIQEYEAREQ